MALVEADAPLQLNQRDLHDTSPKEHNTRFLPSKQSFIAKGTSGQCHLNKKSVHLLID
jgi:hypothetical protein